MALVALAVTLGTPNSVGEVPVTTSNLAAQIAQSVTDTTALAALIATMITLANTADVDAGLSVTTSTTADTASGTEGTNFDAFAAALIAITGDTYNSGTKQFTFGGATGLTHAQIAGALGTALNLVGANQVSTKAATVASLAADNTTKAATASAKTQSLLLSTTAIAADHTAAQAVIATANVFIQSDTGVVTNVGILNGALVSALTIARDNAILPT